ncbi:hypothetical protein KQ313_03130 [Synechococcus sp. CS-1325]|nr:hypothetical protein [Synechococcus sp. CS-1325]
MAIGVGIWWAGVVLVTYVCRNVLGALALFAIPMDLSSGSAWLWGAWSVMVVVLAGAGKLGARILQRQCPQIPARQSAALFLISVILVILLRPELMPVSVEPHDSAVGRSVGWIVSASAVVSGAWLSVGAVKRGHRA